MIDSNSESVDESGSEDLTSKDKSVGIRRDPSFSGWYDEDGIPYPDRLLNDDDVNEEDFDFEIPLIQPHVSENAVLDRDSLDSSNLQQRMEGGGNNDVASANGLRNQTEYIPFDIEDGHDTERQTSSENSLNHGNYDDASMKKAKDPLSIADVLKTLFFILVWYMFSTFLTL